jgi:hypothetical protein
MGCDTNGGKFTRKCIVRKGTDSAFVTTDGERGQHITGVVSVCNNLPTVPPFVIMKGTQASCTVARSSQYPPDSVLTCSDNGWINQDLFLGVIQGILDHVKRHNQDWAQLDPFNRKPLLILLDGHSSHSSWEILTFCMTNSIILLRSPAHCTHIIQVLDSHHLFGAFQTKLRGYIQQACARGNIVTYDTFGTHFTTAFNHVFGDQRRIRRVFSDYGISPFNPQRLDVTKLKQQAVVRRSYDIKRMVQNGVDPVTAAENSSNRSNTALPDEFNYTVQWEKEIQQHFINQVEPEQVESVEETRIKVVAAALVECRTTNTVTTEDSPVSHIPPKKVKEYLRNQATVLTTKKRVKYLKEKWEEEKEAGLLKARKEEYEQKYRAEKAAVQKLNKQNAPLRREASKCVTEAKRVVASAKRTLKHAEQRESKRHKGPQGREQVRTCCIILLLLLICVCVIL